jgi:hypothetical protein
MNYFETNLTNPAQTQETSHAEQGYDYFAEQVERNEREERESAAATAKNRYKPLTKRDLRKKWNFYLPLAVLYMISRSEKPTDANLAFLFALLDRVKYTLNTTAADFEDIEITAREVKIIANKRDEVSKNLFFADRLKSFDLYEYDRYKEILKPTPALIEALTNGNGVNFKDLPTELQKNLYKNCRRVNFSYAEFMCFRLIMRELGGINRELALRVFLRLLCYQDKKGLKRFEINLNDFNMPESYKFSKLFNKNFFELMSHFFEGLKIEVRAKRAFCEYDCRKYLNDGSDLAALLDDRRERNERKRREREQKEAIDADFARIYDFVVNKQKIDLQLDFMLKQLIEREYQRLQAEPLLDKDDLNKEIIRAYDRIIPMIANSNERTERLKKQLKEIRAKTAKKIPINSYFAYFEYNDFISEGGKDYDKF